jgi:iron complex outermembrane recepter protein
VPPLAADVYLQHAEPAMPVRNAMGIIMNRRGATVGRAVTAALASGIGSFAAPHFALAQQEVEQPTGVLEEVIVSAQRRDQALQDVPISIQVVDADLINDTGATDMNDLNGFIPGLVVSGGSPTQPKYQLRGIQTGDFGIGTDPAVGVYVDGIYSARSGASLTTFNDIERVEVLKGPQGTLLGRNSAAGAVSIITHQPTDNWEGNVRARLGDYGTELFSGTLNAPITEGLALRMTGVYNSSDGWIKDAATHKELNPEEEYSFRTALRWEIADATSATLTWDYDNLDQLARPAIGIVPVSDTYPFVPYFDPPGQPPSTDTYLNPLNAKVYNDVVKNDESRDLNRYTLFIDHDFGWANFRSSTAWTKFNTNNREDEDGTNLKPYLYFDTANIEHNESWYQEFKFSHSDDRFDWVAGASYYSEDANQTSDTHTYTDSVDRVLVNTGYAPVPGLFTATDFLYNSVFVPYAAGLGMDLPPLFVTNQTWQEAMYNHGQYSAVAVFGDVIWHATDKMNLTFGLRYTGDDKHFSWLNGPRVAPGVDAAIAQMEAYGFFDFLAAANAQDPSVPALTPADYQFDLVFANNPAIEGQKVKLHDTWNDLSPRFVIDYKYTDDVMFWGSIAKGYKAGGYNSVEIGSVFDPEDVWNYEAGVKSVFPDINLLVNSSVYYYLYKNKQAISLVTQTEGVPKYLIDTSDEQAWGVDLEARWQPIRDLEFSATVAWIDATYSNKKGEDANGDTINLSGDPTGEPYWSLSLGADYVVSFGEYGHTDFSAQWGYRGETRCNAGATLQGTCQVSPNFKVGDSQQRLDLRAAWTSDSEHWGAAVFVTNVFDDQYVDGVNNLTTNTFGTPFAAITPPRQWGVEALYQF